mmetsp:Transcript_39081/g.72816  ORF Transcript_39081/g.72816 Transcript_39081/m.72816 type:complete len:113 (-) Transcript_39081:277-615(-)
MTGRQQDPELAVSNVKDSVFGEGEAVSWYLAVTSTGAPLDTSKRFGKAVGHELLATVLTGSTGQPLSNLCLWKGCSHVVQAAHMVVVAVGDDHLGDLGRFVFEHLLNEWPPM